MTLDDSAADAFMDEELTELAALRLIQHRTAGTRLVALPLWPDDLRPRHVFDAYAIQEAWEDADGDAMGFKLAATNVAGQRHINVDGPVLGTLYTDRALEDGATVSLSGNQMRVAEMELAFRFGHMPKVSGGDDDIELVKRAVTSIHPAIEVPDSRFADYTAVGSYQIMADNACAWHHLIGPAGPDGWRSWDLEAFTVRGRVDGGELYEGVGVNVLGSPWNALVWAARHLAELGSHIEDGDIIITGTLSTPIPIVPGETVTADFGPLGTLSLTFAE